MVNSSFWSGRVRRRGCAACRRESLLVFGDRNDVGLNRALRAHHAPVHSCRKRVAEPVLVVLSRDNRSAGDRGPIGSPCETARRSPPSRRSRGSKRPPARASIHARRARPSAARDPRGSRRSAAEPNSILARHLRRLQIVVHEAARFVFDLVGRNAVLAPGRRQHALALACDVAGVEVRRNRLRQRNPWRPRRRPRHW